MRSLLPLVILCLGACVPSLAVSNEPHAEAGVNASTEDCGEISVSTGYPRLGPRGSERCQTHLELAHRGLSSETPATDAGYGFVVIDFAGSTLVLPGLEPTWRRRDCAVFDHDGLTSDLGELEVRLQHDDQAVWGEIDGEICTIVDSYVIAGEVEHVTRCETIRGARFAAWLDARQDARCGEVTVSAPVCEIPLCINPKHPSRDRMFCHATTEACAVLAPSPNGTFRGDIGAPLELDFEQGVLRAARVRLWTLRAPPDAPDFLTYEVTKPTVSVEGALASFQATVRATSGQTAKLAFSFIAAQSGGEVRIEGTGFVSHDDDFIELDGALSSQ